MYLFYFGIKFFDNVFKLKVFLKFSWWIVGKKYLVYLFCCNEINFVSLRIWFWNLKGIKFVFYLRIVYKCLFKILLLKCNLYFMYNVFGLVIGEIVIGI